MITITSSDLETILDYPSLIAEISSLFAENIELPERAQYSIPVPGRADATLLLMSAWQPGSFIGIKSATIFPSNTDVSLPAVMATYHLLSADTGEPVASLDGKTLTEMRTAATSALAADILSRKTASTHLVIGAGDMCLPLVRAYSVIRDFEQIEIWNRSFPRAQEKASLLRQEGFNVSVSSNLEQSVRAADIVSCATLSTEAIVFGSWLAPGSHLDLIGSFSADFRESDCDAIRQADVYVDTRDGAALEAGDLIRAERESDWTMSKIEADLFELTTGKHPGRRSESVRTVFKSVGVSIEDLAAAKLAYRRFTGHGGDQGV